MSVKSIWNPETECWEVWEDGMIQPLAARWPDRDGPYKSQPLRDNLPPHPDLYWPAREGPYEFTFTGGKLMASKSTQTKEAVMSVTMLKSLIQKLEQTSDLDEVVMGLAQAKALKSAYTETGIPVPEWIAEAVDTLAAEVKRRTQDELKRQEKALVQELEALKSREEKRSEKEQRLAALRERLKS